MDSCNHCGSWWRWPFRYDVTTPRGVLYGRLCNLCWHRLCEPEIWEAERLEFVPTHSE